MLVFEENNPIAMNDRRNQTVSEPLKVFEGSGVEPGVLTQEHAMDYATCRACFRSGGIRILGADFVQLSGSPEWLNRLGKILDMVSCSTYGVSGGIV